jgi:hypothetical protein
MHRRHEVRVNVPNRLGEVLQNLRLWLRPCMQIKTHERQVAMPEELECATQSVAEHTLLRKASFPT